MLHPSGMREKKTAGLRSNASAFFDLTGVIPLKIQLMPHFPIGRDFKTANAEKKNA
jgi:hypothetical protein